MTIRGVPIFKKPGPLPRTPRALLDDADLTISIVMTAAYLHARAKVLLEGVDLRH